MPWGLRRRRQPVDGAGDRVQDARRLRVRTRRQVTDLFAGHYVSAFRGTGIEYTESRPYVPGDDVRGFDWNATARTGVPHVKQHRPERGRTIVAAIDASSTMRFGTASKTKLEAAAEAVALLATAALAVGDRFGVLVHDEDGVHELAPRRGELQLHLLLDLLTGDASHGQRSPCVQGALPSLLEKRRRRGEIVFRFGDARGEDGARSFTSSRRPGASSVAASPLRAPGEGIFVLCSDPGELRWPDAGPGRVVPLTRSGPSLVFDGDDALARARFERGAGERVARVAHAVRARGDDFVHFRTDHDPLRLWLRFFRSRAGGSRSA